MAYARASSIAILLAILLALVASGARALEYRIEAEQVRIAGVTADRFIADGGGSPSIRVRGVSLPGGDEIGDIVLDCSAAVCRQGRLTWRAPDAEPLSIRLRRAARELALTEGGAALRLAWPETGWAVTAEAVPLAWPARLLPPAHRPVSVSGRLDGSIESGDEGLRGGLAVSAAAFDTRDGAYAGSGLALELDWHPVESGAGSQARLAWRAGELLLGPAYLPLQDEPVELRVRWAESATGWQVESVELTAGARLTAAGSAELEVADGGLRLPRLSIDRFGADLDWLWLSGLESLAGAVGWSGLAPSGRLSGKLDLREGRIQSARTELVDVSLDDSASRLQLAGADLRVDWNSSAHAMDATLSWREARIYALPIGATEASFSTRADGRLALNEPWRLPVFDGALLIDRLAWRDWTTPDGQLAMDAVLEPVDLAPLTRALGWPEMGGHIAGRFPGLRVSAGVASFSGGLEIEAFEGRARVDGLTVERPFGTLPALSADVRFERLNLEPLTQTFDVGRMTGLASGRIERLRLLDWQPVRFDAWIETLVDSPDRTISQQAVDSLSQASGGSPVSGVMLRFFDQFPYHKAGLGCELAGSVCTMRGLRDADDGGYVILEGRGLPRLDIVGHQRRVDFPRLIAQLSAAAAAE